VVALPQLGALDAANGPPQAAVGVGGDCAPLCSRGRMLIRRDGALRLTACALVDDDVSFDRPAEVESAISTPIMPLHRRCGLCLRGGVNYVGAAVRRGL
jgi:hypothetical protein